MKKTVRICALTAVSLMVMALQLFAGDIAVTGVAVKELPGCNGAKAIAEITVNNALVLSDVKVLRGGGEILLKFPEHVARNKRVYPQVSLITRQANDAARKAVETGKPQGTVVSPLTYKIRRYTPVRKRSGMKAFVIVSINDAIEIECRVMGGKNGAWIAWPAVKAKNIWIKKVSFIDKRFKENIEQDILDRHASVADEDGNDADY